MRFLLLRGLDLEGIILTLTGMIPQANQERRQRIVYRGGMNP